MWARQGTVLSVRHLTEAIISCIISLEGERREYHFVVPLIRFLTLFCKYPIMISCECGGTAYTADLKSAGETLGVRVPPPAPKWMTLPNSNKSMRLEDWVGSFYVLKVLVWQGFQWVARWSKYETRKYKPSQNVVENEQIGRFEHGCLI